MLKAAVIDLGSNSVRLSVAEIHNKSFKTVFMKRHMVKLSENMNTDMKLKAPAMLRTAQALLDFKKIIKEYGCEKCVAVATAAVRKAENRAEFIEFIKEETGFEINVISGEEEAEYDFKGISNDIEPSDFVIMDIGGASTEIIGVKNREMIGCVSIPYASRNLTEIFLTPETPDGILKTENMFYKEILKIDWLASFCNVPIVGLGGCLKAAAAHILNSGEEKFISGSKIGNSLLFELYDNIKSMDVSERKQLKGIGEKRGDIILGGLIPYAEVSKIINANELIISESGIREGILSVLSKNI